MKFQTENMLSEDLINKLPFSVAALDRNFQVAWANDKFREIYGETEAKHCYTICKNKKFPCSFCKAPDVFQTGEATMAYESHEDEYGRPITSSVYFVPVKDKAGEINHVLEISTHIKDFGNWQKEFNILFEMAPCYITVIDRDFNIIRSNEKFRETFGESRGKSCFEAYKKKKTHCTNCPALESFEDGQDHLSTQIGMTAAGEKTVYMVATAPIAFDEKGPSLVMEIASDITEINKLQEQLKNVHEFYGTIIQNSADGIIAIDQKGKIQIFNKAAKALLNWGETRKPGIAAAREILPDEFFNDGDENGLIIAPCERNVIASDGAEVPVRFSAVELRDKKRLMGRVAFMLDLRPLRCLEEQKRRADIEAREKVFSSLDKSLALLMGMLEEELFRFEDKIETNNPAVISEGLDLMKYKFNKSNEIKNSFIAYSKQHNSIMEDVDLNEVISVAYNELQKPAALQEVSCKVEFDKVPVTIRINRTAISSCVDIMALNALNVAAKSDAKAVITLKAYNDHNVVVLEVEQDYTGALVKPDFADLKEKFFGLTTAELIIKEHLGVIDIIDKGYKVVFKIKLPKMNFIG